MEEDYEASLRFAIDNVTVIAIAGALDSSRYEAHSEQVSWKLFSMYLRAKPSLSPLISNVEGGLYIYNGLFDDSMQKDIIRMSVRGLYLRRTGRLTLFSNAVSPFRHTLWWKADGAESDCY